MSTRGTCPACGGLERTDGSHDHETYCALFLSGVDGIDTRAQLTLDGVPIEDINGALEWRARDTDAEWRAVGSGEV